MFSEFVCHTMDDVSVEDKTRNKDIIQDKLPEVAVSYEDLMARIRHIVLTSRLRVRYFFPSFWTLDISPAVD